MGEFHESAVIQVLRDLGDIKHLLGNMTVALERLSDKLDRQNAPVGGFVGEVYEDDATIRDRAALRAMEQGYMVPE